MFFPLHRVLAFAATLVGILGVSLGLALPAAAAADPQWELRSSVGAVGTLPVAGIAGWPDGLGYWVATATGGVVAVGGAQFYGSMAGQQLNAPVVGIAAAPTGRGYWLVTAQGDVRGFGSARSFGSLAGHRLLHPVVGMATTPDGEGYWLVAADGGIFAFGDARFRGSVPGMGVRIGDAIGLVPADTGAGYYVETPTADYPFGSVYRNVPGGVKDPPGSTVVGAAALFRGLLLVDQRGTVVMFRTTGVYHTTGEWTAPTLTLHPAAVASTAVGRNVFVLNLVGQVTVLQGPGPVPVR